MEKKFRTLSAYLPSRRPSIPPALPFALQNGYGIPAAGQGIVVGTTGRTCPATASGRVTDATAHQASGDALSGDCKLGYARAARIMDEMEQLHIIGPYEGSKPRQVLITRQQWIEMTMQQASDSTPEV